MQRRASSGMPRRETIEAAKRGRARPSSLGAANGWPIEGELAMTRVLASRLFRLLSQRQPYVAAEFAEALEHTGRAAIDRAFEATILLYERHRIEVTPCRRILYAQDEAARRYVLKRVTGESEVVDEEELLMRAGLSPDE